MNNLIPVDYDELAFALFEARCELTPAGVHGMLFAYLILHPATKSDAWLAEWLGESPEIVDVNQTLLPLVTELFTVTQAILQVDPAEFHLYLPTDEELLVERGIALRDWCDGFLSYFIPRTEEMVSKISDEALMEGLGHLMALAELETEIDENEENKVLLEELVDYVTSAALALREAVNGGGSSGHIHSDNCGHLH
jgi:uncharacterized protein YgfB (UPF0149 family)